MSSSGDKLIQALWSDDESERRQIIRSLDSEERKNWRERFAKPRIATLSVGEHGKVALAMAWIGGASSLPILGGTPRVISRTGVMSGLLLSEVDTIKAIFFEIWGR